MRANNDARNNPVNITKGTHTEDIPAPQPSPIIIPDSGIANREPESIVLAGDAAMNQDYADALRMAEEVIEILLDDSGEENPVQFVPVWNNGREVVIPIGAPFKLKRKFVEDLIRSRPISIRTHHEEVGAHKVINRIIPNARSKHPLSVIHDPSPHGAKWLRDIRASL